jgi:hypothetical protein
MPADLFVRQVGRCTTRSERLLHEPYPNNHRQGPRPKELDMTCLTRRDFLAAGAAVLTVGPRGLSAAAEETKSKPLAREVGVTTASVARHLSISPAAGQFTLLELPRLMREELDMRVIDLNTSTLASLEPDYLDQLRATAEKHGCLLTNLKMNYPRLDMSGPDDKVRQQALTQYKLAIDAGKRLGVRWARPLPLKERPDMPRYVAGFRELADYAGERWNPDGRGKLWLDGYGRRLGPATD